jgi:lipopolysaccharide export system permease protein
MIVHRMLLKTFIPVFLVSLSFFVLIIQLMDLFGNLVRYLNLEVPFSRIAMVQFLFIPRAVSFALPVALLFAAAYTLGALYANNELIAVFGAGVSIRLFTAPLLLIGLFLSAGLFLFQEYIVIETYREKNELSRQLLNISRSFSNSNITVRSAAGDFVYSAEYYNDATEELSRLMIIQRDRRGNFLERVDAARASWSSREGLWIIQDGTRYTMISDEGGSGQGAKEIEATSFETIRDVRYSIGPERFRRSGESVDELRFDEAGEWVQALKESGQPYRQALTDYYGRFSFSLTPFIVLLLSSGLGGRFRKNILLMSLLVSLMASVVYYVTGMVMELLAGNAVVPPLVGAWSGVVLFTGIGTVLNRTART